MGDMRLEPIGSIDRLGFGAERVERDRQTAHTGPVAGIVFVLRNLGRSSAPVETDAAPDRMTDVDRLAAHPVAEGFGDGRGVESVTLQDRSPERKTHLRVVGHAPLG